MSSWFGCFWQRHRRKFAVSGVVVVGCYAAGKLVQWRITKWQEDVIGKYVESQRKMYFEKNQETCTATYVSFENLIKNTIEEALDIASLTESLKTKPKNKIEIWEDLKVMSFARAAAAVFGSCIVLVYIKILMNIVAGYMFVDKMKKDQHSQGFSKTGASTDQSTMELYDHCTEFIKYATGEGLEHLIKDVTAIVKDLVGHIGLREELTCDDVQNILYSTWKALRDSDSSSFPSPASATSPIAPHHSYAKYMISPALRELVNSSLTPEHTSTIPQVLLEAIDLTESHDCFTTINSCIEVGLDMVSKDLIPYFQQEVEDIAAIGLENKEPCIHSVPLKLAKIMPLVNAEVLRVFKCAGENKYVDAITSVQTLSEFASNIYESFSSVGGILD